MPCSIRMEDKTPIEELCWSVCPAKIHPRKALFGLLVILLFGALITTTNLILGICLIGVLVGTQATFFFPTRFSLDDEGLRANYPLRTKYYTWQQVRRVKFFKEACYLFTRKKPSNLDGWTGIAVFYGAKRHEVVSAIKSHLSPEVAT